MIKILKGLHILRKTNIPYTRVVLAFHHPDSMTWRWAIWWHGYRSRDYVCWRLPLVKFRKHPRSMYFEVVLPILGEFNLSTQEHMWKNKESF